MTQRRGLDHLIATVSDSGNKEVRVSHHFSSIKFRMMYIGFHSHLVIQMLITVVTKTAEVQ